MHYISNIYYKLALSTI